MLIELKKIIKNYDSGKVITRVLKGIDLSIREGEFITIMGPSGSGKSTLMHIAGFLDRPTSGEYYFNGKDTKNFTDDQLANIRNSKIGFVFQSFNLLPRTSVLDNVMLPLFYSQDKKGYEKKAKIAIEAVGLGKKLHYLSNQISGGEKQKVAIARALVCNPKVIFADEPTGNLDSKSGNIIMSILERLNKEGHTIILVTHDMEIALHADRIVTLHDGEVISDETTPPDKKVYSKIVTDS